MSTENQNQITVATEGCAAASGYVPTAQVCSLHMAHDGTAAARAWCAEFRAAMCEMMDEWTADNPCPVNVAINIAPLRDDSHTGEALAREGRHSAQPKPESNQT